MNKFQKWMLAGIAALLLIVGGTSWYVVSSMHHESEKAEYQQCMQERGVSVASAEECIKDYNG